MLLKQKKFLQQNFSFKDLIPTECVVNTEKTLLEIIKNNEITMNIEKKNFSEQFLNSFLKNIKYPVSSNVFTLHLSVVELCIRQTAIFISGL